MLLIADSVLHGRGNVGIAEGEDEHLVVGQQVGFNRFAKAYAVDLFAIEGRVIHRAEQRIRLCRLCF